jgi:hypothetical protein
MSVMKLSSTSCGCSPVKNSATHNHSQQCTLAAAATASQGSAHGYGSQASIAAAVSIITNAGPLVSRSAESSHVCWGCVLTCEFLGQAPACLSSNPNRTADMMAARCVWQAAQAVAHKLVPADTDSQHSIQLASSVRR